MSKIIINKPTEEELKIMDIDSWSVWTCEVSNFDWEYPEEEICYIYEGEVTVNTSEESVEIKPGDLVTFPKGLKCNWDVKKPIKKVYKFN